MTKLGGATFDITLASDIASVIDLDSGTGPRAIKVSLDGHVVCRGSEEAFVDRSAQLGTCTES